jgi:uncharacterized protein YbjQ (UPF0145 family)
VETLISIAILLAIIAGVVWFFMAFPWVFWTLVGLSVAGAIWYNLPAKRAARERLEAEAAQRALEANRITNGARTWWHQHGQARWSGRFGPELQQEYGLTDTGLRMLQGLWQTFDKEKLEADRAKQIQAIPTSSDRHILGKTIREQIRMIRVDGCSSDMEADSRLREAALEVGADAIINMSIRPYPGGHFSAQGDAVTLKS